jgi:AcrR family transcriptional regulator
LIAAARKLFVENGFHDTGIAELTVAAGLTRGALYHHFGDKEQLFEAVFREVAQELHDAAGDSVQDLAADPWRMLQAGLNAFLNLIADSPDAQQILLLDGPAVFGWERWREIQSEFTHARLTMVLDRLVEAGTIAREPTAPLANLLLAALYDAGMSIAHAADPAAERQAVATALMTLVSGLRR